MSRTPLIAGNWKMNGSRAAVDAFASELDPAAAGAVELLICAPFVYLQQLARGLADAPVRVGAQDVSLQRGAGAFTGDISGAMLADVGCSHVLVGHSERRTLYGETDAVVAHKLDAAAAAGLAPILCVGETLAQRDADQTEAVLERQLQAVLSACGEQALGG